MSPDDDATLFVEPPVFDGGLMHVSHRARADSNGYDASRGNAWALPDPEIFRDKLSLPGWLEREVKLPDCLMGEWLTTTSRVELVAPTGLGKTNLGLAWAAFAAAGLDFLHWRGSGRPRRVLYVDGEMSERLMHSRLKDAVERAEGV